MNRLSLLLFLFSLSIGPTLSTRPESDSLRLSLIRKPPDPSKTRTEHIRDLIHRDRARHSFISATILRKKQPECAGSPPLPPSPPPSLPSPAAKSFAMPMRSGAYTGTGEYFVRFRVGTPAQKFMLVADTGSDLTWVNCKYEERRKKKKKRSGSGRKVKRVFEAGLSRSFHPIECSSDMCVTELPFSLTTCPVPTAPCAYDYGYGFFPPQL